MWILWRLIMGKPCDHVEETTLDDRSADGNGVKECRCALCHERYLKFDGGAHDVQPNVG